jgi:hypothetical protein
MASAGETRGALHLAEATELAKMRAELLDKLDRIIATPWKQTR